MSRILRDSCRSFCSSSVSNEPSSTSDPASGMTSNAIGAHVLHRCGKRDGGPVVHEGEGVLLDGGADLAVELVGPREARPGDGLVRRDDQPLEAGLVVQHLEHRHRGHRGAVRVGDDALDGGPDGAGVHLGDDERDLGVATPRRRVVDDQRTGRGEPGGVHLRRGTAGGEQRDVDARQVRRLDVLDHHVGAAPRQRGPGGARGGEVPDGGDREVALVEQPPHDAAHLAGGTDHRDVQTHGPTVPSRRTRRPRLPWSPARTRCARRGPRRPGSRRA